MVREDYVKRQYFFSSDISDEAYDPACRFTGTYLPLLTLWP